MPKSSATLAKLGLARSEATAAAELVLLDAADVAEGAVVEHHGDQRIRVLDGGGQLLQAELEPAVAVDRDDAAARIADLGAEAVGNP